MPQFETETKDSRSVWKSPDGQREIYEITLDYNGQPVKAKTYSHDIAVVGWKGTVDVYEKQGRNGTEQFVKQPPKDNPSYGGGSAGGAPRSTGYQKDDKAIQAMWAIGQSVAFHTDHEGPAEELVSEIERMAQEFFAMVARVKASEDAPEAPAQPDKVQEVTDEPLDLKMIDQVFNPEPIVDQGELPWPPRS